MLRSLSVNALISRRAYRRAVEHSTQYSYSAPAGIQELTCGDDLVTVVKSDISNFEVCL